MSRLKNSLSAVLVPVLSVLLSLFVGCIVMLCLGKDPVLAVTSLIRGAVGTKGSIGTTLTKATPLIFTGVCACFAYKCGVMNLGGEGQFIAGSVAGFLAAHCLGVQGLPGILLTLLASALAGALWATIPGLLKIYRGQSELITTIMMNYIATLFMGVIYTNWFRDAEVPQTVQVDASLKLSNLIPGMRCTWALVIALLAGLGAWFYLFRTPGGFRMRAVGYNQTASHFNGFPVNRLLLLSFAVSGLIAGLGGGAELLGTQYRLINGYGAGYGFDGIAIALIGMLNPLATIIVALFFAALRAGSMAMQAASGVPTSVSDIIQALMIIFSVAGMALVKLPEFEAFRERIGAKLRKKNKKKEVQ